MSKHFPAKGENEPAPPIRFEDLALFVQAADAGSFSEAARRRGLTPAVASSAVQRLERSLGIRLFVRSTRSLRLSEDGERYLAHARTALQALEDGRLALDQARGEIAGRLRLSAPSDLGRNVLLPWLDAFQQAHPKLALHLRIGDRVADLYRQPLDAGIRYGAPPADSSLVAQPLAPDNRRVLCAAPAYLARHGHPRRPDELRRHECLRYVLADSVHERWNFHLPQGVQTVTVSGRRVSDDADVVRRWAVAGHGLVYKSRLDVLEDLRAGRLVEVFPPGYGEPAPLNLVCAHRSLLSPAIQRLRDFLRERCAEFATP
ncbi:LysR family transcriptional regulator [Frateuria defendens]|uniref:LysR family transcriptional regulator n=1 Tax=Frateuria defendens TaxID=2219559 RepID=UPI00066FE730|nr:LysR family transcriptional regulator [Frateuria defendens]